MERIVMCIFVKNVSILNIFGDSQKKREKLEMFEGNRYACSAYFWLSSSIVCGMWDISSNLLVFIEVYLKKKRIFYYCLFLINFFLGIFSRTISNNNPSNKETIAILLTPKWYPRLSWTSPGHNCSRLLWKQPKACLSRESSKQDNFSQEDHKEIFSARWKTQSVNSQRAVCSRSKMKTQESSIRCW